MASERQIAANRRNARKSTGPRSGAGRKRASHNAYRHGLTLSITSSAAYAKQLDTLVRKIAGDSEDAIVLERARAIAQAELDLARVRRAKVALIERASAFGELDPPQAFGSVTQIIRLLNAIAGVESLPFLSRSTPLQRCHHKNLTDPLKLSDAYCQTCASWTDTSVALLRSESGRFAAFMVEQIRWTICSCTPAKRSQFL
jgi:hypothetical protein